jgi:predicted secreted protein
MNLWKKRFKQNSIKRSIILTFAVLGLFSLTSCAIFNGPTTMNLDNKSNGKNIKAKTGDTIVINLKGNATTGYTWVLQKYNEELLKFIDVKYETENSNLMGAGGTWVATFQIIKSGSSKIEFDYKRPWETKKTPLQNYIVTITAKDK